MKVLAIEKAGPGKPNIWLEAGIHAREWISPAVATFIVRELVENFGEHPEYLENFNWYFIPSANPDGYAYTFSHDRLWRKTRSPQGVKGHNCTGVDLNRNWGFHWGEETEPKDNPCSVRYPGKKPFSEPEARNIRDFLLKLDPPPVLSLCIHSFGKLWMWPYGYSKHAVPENLDEIKELGIIATKALKNVHGTNFTLQKSSSLYQSSGTSRDWYDGVLGSRFTYTLELRDKGRHGFLLPKEQIIPSGEEIWAAMEALIAKLLEKLKKNSQ